VVCLSLPVPETMKIRGAVWLLKVFVVFTVLAGLSGRAQCADVAELIRKGDLLDAQLKTREALNAYLEADQREPGNAEILRRIAREQCLSMVDTESKEEKRIFAGKGLDYAQRAVGADPRNAMARLALAVCYGRVAPYCDAKTRIGYSRLVREETEKSIAIDPSNDYAYHLLGAWNYELAGLSPLLRAVAKLIYGEIPAASYDKSVEYFLKALEMAPGRLAHHIQLGRAYAALGRNKEAKASLTRGLGLPDREKDDPFIRKLGVEALKRLH
jgi:tetratricopeptide (TPR) repeat protein